MEEIYERMWRLAKPYYERGRVYDVDHIKWMMEQAEEVCRSEDLNEKLLMPLVILHDVGYSEHPVQNPEFKSKKAKKAHMEDGARIAKKILEKLDYDPELIERAVHYISVHDNWIFGDNEPYKECKEMAVFSDLDFLWALSSYRMLELQAETVDRTPSEIFQMLIKDEKLENRPLSCDFTRKLFRELKRKRREEIEEKK